MFENKHCCSNMSNRCTTSSTGDSEAKGLTNKVVLFDQQQIKCSTTTPNSVDAATTASMPPPCTPATCTTRSPPPTIPQIYLILTNISKFNNIRSLLLTATAFGCCHVLVIGQKNFHFVSSAHSHETLPITTTTSTTTTSAASSAVLSSSASSSSICDLPKLLQQYPSLLPITKFQTWEQCQIFLQNHSIRLIGIEIHPNAYTIDNFLQQYYPLKTATSSTATDYHYQDIAYMMGNEGQGLLPKHIQSCDAFVRIEQYGTGTASLNVNVAVSIILYRTHWYFRSMFRS